MYASNLLLFGIISDEMTFVIISHVVHKTACDSYYAYGPYVREMNIWLKYVEKVIIVAPADVFIRPESNDLPYEKQNIEFIKIPQFNITGIKPLLRTLFCLPLIILRINKGMKEADHIHIRCPGNVGLISCFVQIFYPRKRKTAKYAGNWDWNSKQPWSYRLQQKILRNTFLTRNMTALVYGEWPDRTKNIKPFFTASYSEKERVPISKRPLSKGVNLAFVGTLTENKSPLTSLEVLRELRDKGIDANLTFCGEGPQRIILEQKISEYGLKDNVSLLGNVSAEKVKEVLIDSHFLIFISRSEGWPKAVSEAMWWGCLPITTPVSCVPWMLNNGKRGELVKGDVNEIFTIIKGYLSNERSFETKSREAIKWSRIYTLEKFESEIHQLI